MGQDLKLILSPLLAYLPGKKEGGSNSAFTEINRKNIHVFQVEREQTQELFSLFL